MRYFISADLKAQYTKENISRILEQGAKLGYKYYAYDLDTEFATFDLAAEGLMKPNAYDAIGIYVIKGDSHLHLGVSDEGGILSVAMEDLCERDLLDCVSDFLSMIKDFAILHIDTMID